MGADTEVTHFQGQQKMELPPDKVPDGLSADEYRRLGLQYSLMGRTPEATEAMKKSAQAMASSGGTPSDQQMQYQAGAQFGASLISLLMKSMAPNRDIENGESEPARKGDPFEELRSQLKAQKVPDEKIEEFVNTIRQSVDQMKHAKPDVPPRDVPEGLSAEEYLKLGKRYKEAGWMEQSRDALQFAIESDPEGETGLLAQRFLRTKLPRRPVPLVAERENICGFNQMFAGDLETARKTFESLIKTYPDFEWPYGNLGSLLIRQGEFERALEILDQALEINPHYVNAWLHRARAMAILSRFEGAQECLDRAMDADPDDHTVKSIKTLIDQLKDN
jgi:tetratricopeptide (TPR) repeat protein